MTYAGALTSEFLNAQAYKFGTNIAIPGKYEYWFDNLNPTRAENFVPDAGSVKLICKFIPTDLTKYSVVTIKRTIIVVRATQVINRLVILRTDETQFINGNPVTASRDQITVDGVTFRPRAMAGDKFLVGVPVQRYSGNLGIDMQWISLVSPPVQLERTLFELTEFITPSENALTYDTFGHISVSEVEPYIYTLQEGVEYFDPRVNNSILSSTMFGNGNPTWFVVRAEVTVTGNDENALYAEILGNNNWWPVSREEPFISYLQGSLSFLTDNVANVHLASRQSNTSVFILGAVTDILVAVGHDEHVLCRTDNCANMHCVVASKLKINQLVDSVSTVLIETRSVVAVTVAVNTVASSLCVSISTALFTGIVDSLTTSLNYNKYLVVYAGLLESLATAYYLFKYKASISGTVNNVVNFVTNVRQSNNPELYGNAVAENIASVRMLTVFKNLSVSALHNNLTVVRNYAKLSTLLDVIAGSAYTNAGKFTNTGLVNSSANVLVVVTAFISTLDIKLSFLLNTVGGALVVSDTGNKRSSYVDSSTAFLSTQKIICKKLNYLDCGSTVLVSTKSYAHYSLYLNAVGASSIKFNNVEQLAGFLNSTVNLLTFSTQSKHVTSYADVVSQVMLHGGIAVFSNISCLLNTTSNILSAPKLNSKIVNLLNIIASQTVLSKSTKRGIALVDASVNITCKTVSIDIEVRTSYIDSCCGIYSKYKYISKVACLVNSCTTNLDFGKRIAHVSGSVNTISNFLTATKSLDVGIETGRVESISNFYVTYKKAQKSSFILNNLTTFLCSSKSVKHVKCVLDSTAFVNCSNNVPVIVTRRSYYVDAITGMLSKQHSAADRVERLGAIASTVVLLKYAGHTKSLLNCVASPQVFVTIYTEPETITIDWNTIVSHSYGYALTAADLTATAYGDISMTEVAGTYEWTHTVGEVLNVPGAWVTVGFYPTNTVKYVNFVEMSQFVTITKGTIFFYPSPISVPYNSQMPVFTFEYMTTTPSIALDDTDVVGRPAISSDAVQGANVGTYAMYIDMTGVASNNYSVAGFDNGSLVTITKIYQATLTLSPLTKTINADKTLQMSAYGGSGPGVITYEIASGGGTISASGLFTAPSVYGITEIAAIKGESTNYYEATSDIATITVMQVQDLLFCNVTPATIKLNGTAQASVTGGSGTGAITYMVFGGLVNINATTGAITAYSVGGYTQIYARKEGDTNYNAKVSNFATLTIEKLVQATLTITSSGTTILINTSLQFAVSGGSGTGAVSYYIYSGIGSINATTGLYTAPAGEGSAYVYAVRASDNTYYEKVSNYILVTVKKPVPIVVTYPSTITVQNYEAYVGQTVYGWMFNSTQSVAGSLKFYYNGIDITTAGLTLNAWQNVTVTAVLTPTSGSYTASSTSFTIVVVQTYLVYMLYQTNSYLPPVCSECYFNGGSINWTLTTQTSPIRCEFDDGSGYMWLGTDTYCECLSSWHAENGCNAFDANPVDPYPFYYGVSYMPAWAPYQETYTGAELASVTNANTSGSTNWNVLYMYLK